MSYHSWCSLQVALRRLAGAAGGGRMELGREGQAWLLTGTARVLSRRQVGPSAWAPPLPHRDALLMPELVLFARGFHYSCQCRSEKGKGSGSGEMWRTEALLRLVGRLGGFYSRKAVLSRSAKALYESCIDSVDYEAMFQACRLPDSFQSWFLVAQLHVWLCLVRLKREGKDGSYVIGRLVSMFWYDVEQRMKVLGVQSSSVRRKIKQELLQEFHGLILAYEEGLLGDDRTLAAAVWRNLENDKAETEPWRLATVVEYIHGQVQHMDQLAAEQLLQRGHVQLLPFTGHLHQLQLQR